MKRKGILALIFILVLAVLIALLLLAESFSPEATIRTVPAALWYLLTTLTTVGYGDIYPVTVFGRIIGALFMLMTFGLLGIFIGILVNSFRGKTIQRLKLSFLQGREWYVFSERNEASIILARSLKKEDPKREIIFADTDGDGSPGRAIALSPEEICSRKKDGAYKLFCIKESDAENERLALSLSSGTGKVFCKTSVFPDKLPDNQQRFCPEMLCARLYWDRFPLKCQDEKILIIGDGKWTNAILEQGLLRNVVDPAQHVSYTVAGDISSFLREHPQLDQALIIDTEKGGKDTLNVIEHWNEDPELIRKADRIIFCGDDEEETRRDIGCLRRYFPARGEVHARLSDPFEGIACFGSAEELYTRALVMNEALNKRAMAVNERYRSMNPDAPQWKDLSDFTRRSNMAASDHLLVKLRLLGEDSVSEEACERAWERFSNANDKERERFRRIEHARWQRFHFMHGWQYSAQRNNEERMHPLLVPFEKLSPEDQKKDDFSWEMIHAISRKK